MTFTHCSTEQERAFRKRLNQYICNHRRTNPSDLPVVDRSAVLKWIDTQEDKQKFYTMRVVDVLRCMGITPVRKKYTRHTFKDQIQTFYKEYDLHDE